MQPPAPFANEAFSFDNHHMETKADRRYRKLNELLLRYGNAPPDAMSRPETELRVYQARGATTIGEIAKVNPVGLMQVIKGVTHKARQDGTAAPRGVGDRIAERIEAALKLGTGWFDSDESEGTLPPDAMQVAREFNGLQGSLREQAFSSVMSTISGWRAIQAASPASHGPSAPPTPPPARGRRRR